MEFVNAADDPNNPDVIIDLSETVLHNSRLHTLKLWSNEVKTWTLQVTTDMAGRDKVTFTNGLIVWDSTGSHVVSVGAEGYAVIGWWKRNKVGANYAAVWWWEQNDAQKIYAVIGGWQNNTAKEQNSVVVGWFHNTTNEENSVVVGWQNNIAQWQNSVVVGWNNNRAAQNSLALWTNSVWKQGSFAWNGDAEQNQGYIGATNWILVNTTTPIDWVNLVVNGAVKIAWKSADIRHKWEIRYVGKCFYAYDGTTWHLLNRWRENQEDNGCIAPAGPIAQHCKFGNTILWDGDSVVAYSKTYAVGAGCDDYKATITCNNWALSLPDHIYAYCYSIHD